MGGCASDWAGGPGDRGGGQLRYRPYVQWRQLSLHAGSVPALASSRPGHSNVAVRFYGASRPSLNDRCTRQQLAASWTVIYQSIF